MDFSKPETYTECQIKMYRVGTWRHNNDGMYTYAVIDGYCH